MKYTTSVWIKFQTIIMKNITCCGDEKIIFLEMASFSKWYYNYCFECLNSILINVKQILKLASELKANFATMLSEIWYLSLAKTHCAWLNIFHTFDWLPKPENTAIAPFWVIINYNLVVGSPNPETTPENKTINDQWMTWRQAWKNVQTSTNAENISTKTFNLAGNLY